MSRGVWSFGDDDDGMMKSFGNGLEGLILEDSCAYVCKSPDAGRSLGRFLFRAETLRLQPQVLAHEEL